MQYYLFVVVDSADVDSVVDAADAGVLVLLLNKCPSCCERKSRCVGDFVVGGGVVGYNSNLGSCCCCCCFCLRREKRKIRESRLRLLRRFVPDLMRMMIMRRRRWWRMCEYWIESECDSVVVVVAPVAVVCVSEWQILVDAVVVGVLRCVAAAAAEHPYFQQVTLHSPSNHFQNSVD